MLKNKYRIVCGFNLSNFKPKMSGKMYPNSCLTPKSLWPLRLTSKIVSICSYAGLE